MLNVIDGKWKDHLYDLDHLQASIGFRGWGEKDPLGEYKQEACDMFGLHARSPEDDGAVLLPRPIWSATAAAAGSAAAGVLRASDAPAGVGGPAGAPPRRGPAAQPGAGAGPAQPRADDMGMSRRAQADLPSGLP